MSTRTINWWRVYHFVSEYSLRDVIGVESFKVILLYIRRNIVTFREAAIILSAYGIGMDVDEIVDRLARM